MPWTEDHIERLKVLWEDGKQSVSQIAAEFHMSRNAIIGKAHRLMLPPRRRAPPRDTSPRKPRWHRPRLTPYAVMKKKKEQEARSLLIKETFEKPVVVPVPEPILNPIPLMLLKAGDCRWPVNEGGPYLFCGAAKINGHSYCEKHHMMSKSRAA